MKPVFIPAALVLTLLLTAGCTPKTEPAGNDFTPPPNPTANSPPNPTTNPPQKSAPAAQAPKVPTRAFDESLLRGREFLLETTGAAPRVRDFDLGTLGTDAKLNKVVEDFFRDAADGTLESARVSPRWEGFLGSWAASYKTQAKKWDSIQVGDAVEEDLEVVVPFKLLSGTAGMSGWLALTRSGSDLLVSDVRLLELVPRTSPFDPDEPQEISSPNRR